MFDPDAGGYSALPNEAKWYLHAYRYGFRRVVMNSRDEFYPADPDGTWFSADLADQAEEFWRHELRKPLQLGAEPARYREAAAWRENAAQERGYDSFKHAMAVGLRRTGLAADAPRQTRDDWESA